jgi:hypothetical protein
VDGQRHASAALPPANRPDTHYIGGWVCPMAGRDGCRKPRLHPGFDLRTVQSVVSRYTDRGIPALTRCECIYNIVYVIFVLSDFFPNEEIRNLPFRLSL